MIIDILQSIYIGFIRMVIWLLPEWHLPDFIVSAFNYFMFFIAGITMAFPFLFAVWVMLSIMVLYKFTVKMANLLFGAIALIRGSGKPEI